MNRSLAACSRRKFLATAAAAAGSLTLTKQRPFGALAAGIESGVSDLPAGPTPAPVSFPHFPDRLHAFVWRNWPLVTPERMASVVGARKTDILRMGHAMGLDGPPRITADQQRRSYISVIKRNWHLLPYEQLLELLGCSASEFAFTLREDDFLFVKLGNAKPHCERLRYEAPGPDALARERQIAAIVKEAFPSGVTAKSEPLFNFVAELSRKPAQITTRPRSENLRFCYSYFALYGDPLLDTKVDPYPEGYLSRLAEAGVNGVWMQAILYKLAMFPWDPQRSSRFEQRLKNLRELARRAHKHGMRLFLYLNEPRAMPLKFFESHPSLKGVVEGEYATLCTSIPEVQDYLVKAVEGICHAVPELGGFFSISASENLTNCWSHGAGAQCPRCAARGPAPVLAEVNRLFQQGITNSGHNIRLLAWDWGWNDAWATEAIQQLPRETSLMSASEWLLPIERGGIKSEVGEYSLSAIGPGPRAQRHWKSAQERGLRAVAKIQAGNTWELSAIPWIPAVANAARHAENLSRLGVQDLMLGWTLGGYPSPNLEVVSETLACGSAEDGLARVAEKRFGPQLAPAVVKSWRQFSAAFSEFPYDIGVVYSGPQQLGPANLLWEKPTGYHATMVGFPYDDLDAWRAIYPTDTFINQLNKVADDFVAGVCELRTETQTELKSALKLEWQRLEDELRMAEAAAIHFRSCANQARFVQIRNARSASGDPAENAKVQAIRQILTDEHHLAQRLHRLQAADSRIGFEASNQYYYVSVDLAEKVLNCQYLLARL